MELTERLAAIQRDLNAPKNQTNKFGGYNYRSCEDILMAVKPLLNGLVLTVTDDIVQVGQRVYIKATAKVTDGTATLETVAFAREPESKKGFDESQITGSASSYARKYALNGLLLIDDNKDADTMDNRKSGDAKPAAKTPQKTGVIKATDGAMDELDQGDQIRAKMLADGINHMFSSDNEWGVWEEWELCEESREFKLAVWSLLTSGVRSYIKKQGQLAKEKQNDGA